MRLRRKFGDISAQMGQGTPIKTQLKVLTDDEVAKVHRASLTLLENIGIANPTPRVIEAATAKGCQLDDRGRLLFPSSLVEDMIDVAAKTFVVHGRDPLYDWQAKNGNVNLCTGGAAVTMLDINSRDYRPSNIDDLYDLARLCDTLENIQWFTRPVVATEIDDLFALDTNTIYASAAGTQKHIGTSFTRGKNVYQSEALLDALGGYQGSFRKRPFCSVHATNIVSPLTFATDSLDVTCAAIDIGMPVHAQTGPQAGATAPAALAGTLAQGCAESLASLSIINILKPGHPVIIGNWVFVSDLRTGAFSGGGGEQALLGAGAGQMSSFYGIPGGMGAGMTDAKVPDGQASYEKALTMLTGALSGGGLVFESAGMLASLLGCSHEAMIIDNEMLGNLRRIARGIEVTDESLSVDVVQDTVDGPGHYLGHNQTISIMETEYDYPKIANRQTPADWKQEGAKDIWERASERAKRVLAEHNPKYIDSKTDSIIRSNYDIKLKYR